MAIKHSITLSTTEPNNEVGNLKIRQADEQTQTLVVQITADGVPKSFVGYQPFFCAKLGQTAGLGIIEQKVTGVMNPANGTLEYVMLPQDWRKVGRQIGYFAFRKMKNEHEWTEQFSTRDFTYNVIPSATGEIKEVQKDGSTYIWTIEDMLRLFDEYIASGKTDWEEFVKQNRDVLESVDPGGAILSEIIRSRKNEDDEIFVDLPSRLSANDKTVATSKQKLFFGQKNIIVGHQGCSMLAPTNSVKAFELAYHRGMQAIETDLRVTADGKLVCYHDADLSTQTDGSGKIEEITYDYLSTLRYTKAKGADDYPNEKIATFAEYLQVAKKYNLTIFPEIAIGNSAKIAEAFSLIRFYGLTNQCVALVNRHNYQVVKDVAPGVIRCLIPAWGPTTNADIDFCAENKIEVCGVAASTGTNTTNYLTQQLIDYANSKNIYLNAYIINNLREFINIKNLGLAFISTDIIGGDQ